MLQSAYILSSSSSTTPRVSEIEEENSSDLFDINHGVPLESIKEDMEGSLFSFDVHNNGDHQADCVYVGIRKSESTMDELSWTLKNAINDSNTMVYRIHIFPGIHHIPSPLGKLPKSQVSVPILMTIRWVKVDTVIIESDMVGKAMMDLIPILNMRKLVLGTSKSNLRKLRSRKGNGIADQELQNTPEFCDVKIICDGRK